MTVGKINDRVVIQRVQWIKQMREALKDLPLQDKDEFLRNPHYVAAAESYLRRALEALFDIGRHILARKFAYPAAEYKEIANGFLKRKSFHGKILIFSGKWPAIETGWFISITRSALKSSSIYVLIIWTKYSSCAIVLLTRCEDAKRGSPCNGQCTSRCVFLCASACLIMGAGQGLDKAVFTPHN